MQIIANKAHQRGLLLAVVGVATYPSTSGNVRQCTVLRMTLIQSNINTSGVLDLMLYALFTACMCLRFLAAYGRCMNTVQLLDMPSTALEVTCRVLSELPLKLH